LSRASNRKTTKEKVHPRFGAAATMASLDSAGRAIFLMTPVGVAVKSLPKGEGLS